jgi:hypothetical protein
VLIGRGRVTEPTPRLRASASCGRGGIGIGGGEATVWLVRWMAAGRGIGGRLDLESGGVGLVRW